MPSISRQDYRNAKILVVDDEPANVKLLQKILEQHGYQSIVSTTESRTAIELYQQHEPDILLLDLNMPNKSGFDIMEELNDFQYDYLPILVLTAYSDQEIRIRALELGAKDYLVKPIEPLEVVTRINNILQVKFLLDYIQTQKQQLEYTVETRTRKLREEIEKRKEAELETIYAATHDGLTELPNYFALINQMNRHLGKSESSDQQALIVLSLDRFNEINKTLGHQNGDTILRIIANRIRTGLRRFPDEEFLMREQRGDTVARYAGGKFAVLIRFVQSVEQVVNICNRLLSNLNKPIEIEGLSLEVPATIGIAMYPLHSENSNALIRHAEIALQAARDQDIALEVFSKEIDTYSPHRLALMADLRRAIQTDSLLLYYQPIIKLSSENIDSVEALVRWPRAKHGVISPEAFIPNAEQSGLIKSITDWVLETAIREISGMRSRHALKVSVNMSAQCLQDQQLPLYIKRLLKNYQFPAAMLSLEITESAMMKNPQLALQTLNRLHQIGIELSIDDFGTGYSSLSYLKRLPVDKLKIDRTFVKDLVRDENDKRIVQSTIDMSHNFGLEVVAEGAEDRETVELLKLMGSDYVQGNVFAQAMPLIQLGDWLKHEAWVDNSLRG